MRTRCVAGSQWTGPPRAPWLFGVRRIRSILCVVGCLIAGNLALAGDIPPAAYQRIRSLMDERRNSEAESALTILLKEHPGDSTGLGLMALVLDLEGRSGEAETCYQNALRASPKSVFLLNNLGRHYTAGKHLREARDSFTKALAVDPANSFALLNLAELSVAAGEGRRALDYLGRLPREQEASPATVLLRARAFHFAGQDASAAALLGHIDARGPASASLYFSAGLLLAEWKHYREAQSAFARALEAEPGSFNIQYNLGLASAEMGDLDRAREIFEHAVARRPDDVDCLLHLALVYQRQGDNERSLPVLFRAAALDPKRADVLWTIAQVTEKLGMYGDSAQAWDKYLALRPEDDVARRERGFAAASSDDLQKGLADLRWFHAKHPDDPEGLFELAIAEARERPQESLDLLNRAILNKPGWIAAHYTRAALQFEHASAEEARKDVEYVVREAPDNFRAHSTCLDASRCSRAIRNALPRHSLVV